MAGAISSLSKTNLSRLSISPAAPSAYKLSVTAHMAQNLSYWDSIQSDIESHLKKVIPVGEPISVFGPMHHLTFAAPKTTASALCVAACEIVGGKREDAIVAASAIHIMHAAAYTHKRLISRNKGAAEFEPEIPDKYGPNIRLLTGDGIMPFGFEILAKSIDPAGNNSDKILRVIIEITRAVAAQATTDVEGQDDYDVDIDRSSGQPPRPLYGCGAACGAILGGGNEEEIERCKRFGVYVGKIEGLLSQTYGNGGGKMQFAEKLRGLALKELEHFDRRKIEKICSIIESKDSVALDHLLFDVNQ